MNAVRVTLTVGEPDSWLAFITIIVLDKEHGYEYIRDQEAAPACQEYAFPFRKRNQADNGGYRYDNDNRPHYGENLFFCSHSVSY